MKKLLLILFFTTVSLLCDNLKVQASQEEIIDTGNSRIPTLKELTISYLNQELNVEDQLEVLIKVPEAWSVLIPNLYDKGENLYNYLNTLESSVYNTPPVQAALEFIEDNCARLIIQKRDEDRAEEILNQPSFVFKPRTIREVALEKKVLYLKGCSVLPPSIFQDPALKSLKILDQDHSGDSALYPMRLKTISPAIDRFVHLEILTFRCNFLHSIPKELFNLKNLKTLNLNGNMITVIPSEMNTLTQLKNLSLGSNKIKVIFPFIDRLTNLEELNLQDNLIESLKDFPKTYLNLKTLSLSSNPISQELEKSINSFVLPSIKYLYLNNMGLNVIPRSIQNFTHLEKLEIGRNNIVLLPKWIREKKYFNSKDITS